MTEESTTAPRLGADDVRKKLELFRLAMARKLDENAHKGGWEEEKISYFFERLIEESVELRDAIIEFRRHPDASRAKEVLGEAADVANFALMIADVVGALDTGETG